MSALLRELIVKAITKAGGDGLCNGFRSCGCSVRDFAPCDDPDPDECTVAKGRLLGPGEEVGDLGPGDILFEPI
jgi:hypothetical protein